MRGNVHVRFGGRERGDGAGVTRPPRPLPTRHLPCDNRAADIRYNISRRHERASTIITTNLAFKQWGTVFPGAACVVALVDRFAQHCHRLTIDAESWREKHGFEHDEPTPSRRRPRRRRR